MRDVRKLGFKVRKARKLLGDARRSRAQARDRPDHDPRFKAEQIVAVGLHHATGKWWVCLRGGRFLYFNLQDLSREEVNRIIFHLEDYLHSHKHSYT